KNLESCMRARPELPLVKHTPNCCQQIQIVLERIALYLLPGCLADSASRCVDDAQQADRVLERKRELQVREDVLDFGALIETESAHDDIFSAVAPQGFFDLT